MMENEIDRELLEKIADMLGKPVGAGAQLLGKIGNRHIFAADGSVSGQNPVRVRQHIRQRNMRGDGSQPRFFRRGLHLSVAVSVKPGQLHAVIAHFFDLPEGALQVLFRKVPDRIYLQRNWKFHHTFLLLLEM